MLGLSEGLTLLHAESSWRDCSIARADRVSQATDLWLPLPSPVLAILVDTTELLAHIPAGQAVLSSEDAASIIRIIHVNITVFRPDREIVGYPGILVPSRI